MKPLLRDLLGAVFIAALIGWPFFVWLWRQ
jgi:hypothetical protein